MSTASVDTARTTEQLSAFKSRIEEELPVDNIFVEFPTFDLLWKNKKMIDGGRQSMIPLDTAVNSTVDSFSGYDTFNVTPQDTARTAVFAYINYGATISISFEEMRETANDKVRIFNLVEHKRRNTLLSMRDRINSDLFAASLTDVNNVNPLPVLVTTSGTVGGIDSSASTYWQSQENTSVGAFTTNGLTQMRNLWNDILRQGQGGADLTMTTQAVFESYESELDVDVRYSDTDKLSRGAKTLEFKGKPFLFDNDCTSGHMYMLDYKSLYLVVDEAASMTVGDFIEPYNQAAYTAKVLFRGQLVMTNRRALGRNTGIS